MSLKNGSTDTRYTFKIYRYNPDCDTQARYDTFVKAFPRGTTVLEALLNLQETQDDSIAFRYSCRSAVCGSCGMVVNGAPVLACRTQLSALIGEQVLVEPLPNMEIIKDLVVDMRPFWEAYHHIEPWLHADREHEPTAERLQSPDDVKKLDPYINCILCACCYGACPVLHMQEQYVGPAAIAKLFRFMQDSRDQRGPQFLERLNSAQGLWACHTIFRCVDACPKDIRPTDTIEALRRRLVVYKFKKMFHLL